MADGTTDYICNVCNSVFKKHNNFAQHYKEVHLKKRPKLRSCHLCDVKVPGHRRAFHMEEHGLPAPCCESCGKKFAYPHQVLRHQRFYHMGEKDFACKLCDFKCSTPHYLRYHERSHSSNKPFQCDYCKKCFRWKKNVTTHIMGHLGIKKHECVFCSAAFVQQNSLKYHISKHHPGCH